ncbi:ABC transporter ATP-binding protein [Mesobacterium pallidum]|uniref:ABC transporter ATP-binding protein n=1 Tax=Mesobacterium pallidum TaxID=2872037 RepID=UPI001EE28B02|nr:ABC transporter ATP-binding protein [Mesobacterium pallidum]
MMTAPAPEMTTETDPAMTPLLDLSDVTIALRQNDRKMVTGVSLSVMPREVFGIVGESGSGKTLFTRTVFGLHEDTYLAGGTVRFNGRALPLNGYRRAIKKMLGKEIGYIPQDPYSSLNPSMRVGRQLTEALYLSKGYPMRSQKAQDAAVALLAEVGIPEPELAFRQYPDQFSGGMRQRIVIAIALSQDPELMIADEPTTALDAFTQRRIMDLILERSRTRGLAVLLISHNLELLRQSVDRLGVLYGGQLLNVAATADIGAREIHPYTQALFDCVPGRDKRLADIASIPGEPVGAGFGTTGCAFAGRCAFAQDICRSAPLVTNTDRGTGFSACVLGKGARHG